MTKRGVVLSIRVVIFLEGELVQEIDIFVKGSVFLFISFLFFTFQIHCSYIVIANLVLIFYVYIY